MEIVVSTSSRPQKKKVTFSFDRMLSANASISERCGAQVLKYMQIFDGQKNVEKYTFYKFYCVIYFHLEKCL